ncbi:MAG: hypothetical protein HY904_03750 [Deltaproteobacteria bacterium]|nr:hypothetical protein [Deltaproteobacteria bacterium]
MFRTRGCLWVAWLVAGCSRAAPPAPPAAAAWSPVTVDSRFLPDVTLPPRATVPPPGGSYALRFQLGQRVEHHFRLEQRVVDNRRPAPEPVRVEALLALRGSGDGRARVSLEGIQTFVPENPRPLDVPPAELAVLTEDGPSGPPSSQTVLVQVLFPLPQSPLRVGEAEVVPVRLPVSGAAVATGSQHIRLERLVRDGPRTLAELHVELRVDAPTARLTGRGVYAFDVEKRAFVDGAAAFLLETGDPDAGVPRVSHDNFFRYRELTATAP